MGPLFIESNKNPLTLTSTMSLYHLLLGGMVTHVDFRHAWQRASQKLDAWYTVYLKRDMLQHWKYKQEKQPSSKSRSWLSLNHASDESQIVMIQLLP